MYSEIYFFSGTGNSHNIAKKLAEGLENAKLIHIPSLDLTKEVHSEADVIGVVFPIYFYDAPDIVKRFLDKLRTERTSYVFLYECFGGSGGNTIANCSKILAKNSVKLGNYFSLQQPDNCILFKQDKKKNDALIASADKKIASSIAHIKNYRTKVLPKTKLKYSIMSNAKLKNISISLMKFKEFQVDTDKCTSCGLCEKVCPVNNIKMDGAHPKFSDKCEMCFACIHYCPSKCIRHGMMKKKKNYQYHNPNISMIEVINK